RPDARALRPRLAAAPAQPAGALREAAAALRTEGRAGLRSVPAAALASSPRPTCAGAARDGPALAAPRRRPEHRPRLDCVSAAAGALVAAPDLCGRGPRRSGARRASGADQYSPAGAPAQTAGPRARARPRDERALRDRVRERRVVDLLRARRRRA